ncbi:hypothetical protein [Anatilimnocola floriformis]|uniref:hypothetical protein n=1 Tax=Anatilimnocola floriformis TaxID=2948575 RepID=UPI0020C54FCB|nr:hypothetical protein [Anatilimnocola floriformis]
MTASCPDKDKLPAVMAAGALSAAACLALTFETRPAASYLSIEFIALEVLRDATGLIACWLVGAVVIFGDHRARWCILGLALFVVASSAMEQSQFVVTSAGVCLPAVIAVERLRRAFKLTGRFHVSLADCFVVTTCAACVIFVLSIPEPPLMFWSSHLFGEVANFVMLVTFNYAAVFLLFMSNWKRCATLLATAVGFGVVCAMACDDGFHAMAMICATSLTAFIGVLIRTATGHRVSNGSETRRRAGL